MLRFIPEGSPWLLNIPSIPKSPVMLTARIAYIGQGQSKRNHARIALKLGTIVVIIGGIAAPEKQIIHCPYCGEELEAYIIANHAIIYRRDRPAD